VFSFWDHFTNRSENSWR